MDKAFTKKLVKRANRKATASKRIIASFPTEATAPIEHLSVNDTPEKTINFDGTIITFNFKTETKIQSNEI